MVINQESIDFDLWNSASLRDEHLLRVYTSFDQHFLISKLNHVTYCSFSSQMIGEYFLQPVQSARTFGQGRCQLSQIWGFNSNIRN